MATDDDRPDEETSTFVDAPSIAHVLCHQTVVYRDSVANDRENCDDDRGAAATSNAPSLEYVRDWMSTRRIRRELSAKPS